MEDGGTTSPRFRLASNITSSDYNFSIYTKGTDRYLQLSGNISTADYVNFDLSDGTIGTNGSGITNAKIESLANGWYRCSGLVTATNVYYGMVENKTSTYQQSYTGDGTSGVLIAFPQLEENDVASSYILTDGSTVTRVKDDVQLATLPAGTTLITEYFTDGTTNTPVVSAPYTVSLGSITKIIME